MKTKDPLKNHTTAHHAYVQKDGFRLDELGVPMTEFEYNDVFLKLVHIKNFLNEKKSPHLERIFNDVKLVTSALMPLYNLGLSGISVFLAGDAVREFVLSRVDDISKMSLVVSLDLSEEKTLEKLSMIDKKVLMDIGFVEEDVDTIGFNGEPFGILFGKLVSLCLNKVFPNDVVRGNDVGGFWSKGLVMDILNVSGKKLNYDFDVLISSASKDCFLNSLDVNFAKIAFSFVELSDNEPFPSNYSHLISRVYSCPDFFADVLNKKITFTGADVSAKLDYLNRVQSVYADYDLNVVSP